MARPRPPAPPWPEIGILSRVRWDEPLRWPANQVIDTNVYAESWSGYALRRSDPVVSPWLVSMLGTNGAYQIDPRQGAYRAWLKVGWSSLSTGLGTGAGHAARVLTLAATNGSQSEVFWSLAFSEDGNTLDLACQTEDSSAVCLSGTVSLQSNVWYLVTLGYTETNTVLFLNQQRIALGGGLLSAPGSLAPSTSLVVGGSLAGDETLGGQVEELAIFGGSKAACQARGWIYGLDPDWEIGSYYGSYSLLAAKGPIADTTLPVPAVSTSSLADTVSALSGEESEESGDDGSIQAESSSGCATGGTVYFTNFTSYFDPTAGWTVSFQIAGGTAGIPYEICMATNLALTDYTGHAFWTWLGRGYTCNRYTFSNQPAGMAFYILGDATIDPDGDGLSTPYESLVSHTSPTSYTLLSSDGYGTPDAWYLAHGLNPLSPGIGAGDANGDGVLNWREYRQGTDPVAAAAFGIWVGSPGGFSGIP